MKAGAVGRTLAGVALVGSALVGILGSSRLKPAYDAMAQDSAWKQSVAYAVVEERLADAQLELSGSGASRVIVPCGVGCMVPAYSPPDQPEPEKAHAALEDALSLYRTTTAEGLLDKLSLEPRIRAVQATLSHSETYQNAPVPVGT